MSGPVADGFSPAGLLLRPAAVAPGLHGGATDFATLFLSLGLGAALVLGAVRHAALGPLIGAWDVFFLTALLAPVAGYALLRAAARVAVFTLGRNAEPGAGGTLAELFAWCLLPVLAACALVAIPILGAGLAWFDGPRTPFFGGGATGAGLALLAAAALLWSLWAMTGAAAARFGVSRASAAVLVSSTIAVLFLGYALLIVVLSAMIG